MHNELNRVAKKPKYKAIDCDKEPINSQSEIWHNYFRERDNSIITDLFEGQLCSSIKCLKCGYQSLSFDSFLDLSLSIRGRSSMTIEDVLSNFIEPESMENSGYRCGGCKKRSKLQKQMTIFRFPKVLVIHFKRFEISRISSGKLTTTISMPKSLNMKKYATPESEHPSRDSAATYKLYGISHHSGSLHGGHYVGEVLDFDSGKWYECNDDSCSRNRFGPPGASRSAYVLFYI